MARLLTHALLLACLAPAACAMAQPKPPPLDAEAPSAPRARPAPNPQATAGPGVKPPPLPPGQDRAMNPGSGGEGRRTVSSGSGFVVAPGRVLTNAHVTEGCATLRVRTSNGTELTATIGARDIDRDLALLAVQGDPGPPLPFRSGPDLRRGDGVVTYGFPLAGLLGSGPTLTTGDVSALSGLRDNQQQFQISAPVQPGNSGGPLLDLNGNIVGVVTSKLNAQRIAQSTGDIPQNVNFAVKGPEAIEFLRRNGVQPNVARSTGALRSAAEVGEVAHPSTVFLRCLG